MDWLALLKPWTWPEYVVKWWKGIYEIREARAKALKAEAETRVTKAEISTAEWEAKVSEMVRNLRQLRNEIQAKHPGKNIVPEIKPVPDDDLEVFNEAMRRIKKEGG